LAGKEQPKLAGTPSKATAGKAPQQAMHHSIQEATEENQGRLENILCLGGPVDQLHLWKEISMIPIIVRTYTQAIKLDADHIPVTFHDS
jgi:hypothetical protein